MRRIAFFLICLATSLFSAAASAEEMRLAVTTSFNNSGLSDVLLPEIKRDLGFDVHLLVVGTGQALRLGRAGDVDAVLVHSKQDEEMFILQGYATHRREIMFNDFVVVGPEADPADVASSENAVEALRRIAQLKSVFVSRGDKSGTHKKEMSLWQKTGLRPNQPDMSWYRETGSGMGAALNTASGMDGYILSDRASWLNFSNKGGLKLLYSGDPDLFNPYAYMPINPEKHDHVKSDFAIALENWLAAEKAQMMIAGYTIGGEALFFPIAE